MYRSSSSTRVAEDYYLGKQSRSSTMEMDHLPVYDPQSEPSKKEATKLKFAENLVHLIPLVILLCAVLLWLFSNPYTEVLNKDDSLIARVKNMTLDGYSSWNSSSMTLAMDDLDPIDEIEMDNSAKDFTNKDPE